MPTTKELLKTRFDEVRAEIDVRRAGIADKRARREALLQQQLTLDAEIDALSAEIQPHDVAIASLKGELSNIAIALGANRLSSGEDRGD